MPRKVALIVAAVLITAACGAADETTTTTVPPTTTTTSTPVHGGDAVGAYLGVVLQDDAMSGMPLEFQDAIDIAADLASSPATQIWRVTRGRWKVSA